MTSLKLILPLCFLTIVPGFASADSAQHLQLRANVTVALVNHCQTRVRFKDRTEAVRHGGGMQLGAKSSGRWLLIGAASSSLDTVGF